MNKEDKYNHHYFVSYNSSEWEQREVIVYRTHPYEDVEEWVTEVEEETNDSAIQVEQFKEISGFAAFILGLF